MVFQKHNKFQLITKDFQGISWYFKEFENQGSKRVQNISKDLKGFQQLPKDLIGIL